MLNHDGYYTDKRVLVFCLLICVIGLSVLLFWFGKSAVAKIAGSDALADQVRDHGVEVWETTDTIELASMNVQNGTSVSGDGSSFVGTGAFVVRSSSDQSLHYIERLADGGFSMDSLPAANTIIYEIPEGTDEKPRIETQTCQTRGATPKQQAWIDQSPKYRSVCYQTPDSYSTKPDRVLVYVPAGTVVDSFNVNDSD